MLECLVALVVLSCMCQLFQLMIQQSFIGNQYLKNNDSKSWHIFLIQLEKNVKSSFSKQALLKRFLSSTQKQTRLFQFKSKKIKLLSESMVKAINRC